MKNLILIIGALLIALNTLIGLILSDYSTLNFLLADLSLVLSAGIIYVVTYSKMAPGFKIGLTGLFIFTGIVRCLCVALMPSTWENNMYLIAAIGLLFVELTCLAGVYLIGKK